MAHIKTKYSGLNKPQDINIDKIDAQKMFVDNIDKQEQMFLDEMKKTHKPVSSITELRAIDTSDSVLYVDNMSILVKTHGIFYFDRNNATTYDSKKVIAPTVGGGRWILSSNSIPEDTVYFDDDVMYSGSTPRDADTLAGRLPSYYFDENGNAKNAISADTLAGKLPSYYFDVNGNAKNALSLGGRVADQYTTYNQTYTGNPITIPNTKAGDYILPSIKGYTKITKPNPNAEISPTNIATLQNVVNPVFTASDGKGDSTTATLQAELYSLPNGVRDEYDGVSDKLTKNIINRELTGNENWLLEPDYSSTDYPCFYAITKGDNCIDNSYVLCTHLKYNANFAVLNTDIGIAIKNNGNNVIKIYVKVNKEIASTSPEFSSWIRNQKLVGKPVKLSYQLATPIVTYSSIKLTTYDGTTTVNCNDTVLQNMSVTVADSRKIYGAINADMLNNRTSEWYIQSNPNLLINGDFSIWQRGATTAPVTYGYTADRWFVGLGAANLASFSRNGNSGMKISFLSNGYLDLQYKVDVPEKSMLLNKPLTISISINDVVTSGNITLSSLDDFVKIEYGTKNISVGTPAYTQDLLFALMNVTSATGTNIVVDWVKLELGDHATPFIPRQVGEELVLCQRYYQKSNMPQVPILWNNTYKNTIYYPVTMRSTPNIQIGVGSGNANDIVFIGKDQSSFHWAVNDVLNKSNIYLAYYTADAEL